jgi:cytochrome c oxidase subunit IV
VRVNRQTAIRALDSYASLLVLLLANFFVIELVTDARWGAVASILLAAAALIVAISDPDAGEGLETWHWILIAVCLALAPVVLLVTSSSGCSRARRSR